MMLKKGKLPLFIPRFACTLFFSVLMPIPSMAQQQPITHLHKHFLRRLGTHDNTLNRTLSDYQSKPALIAFLGMIPATGNNPSAQETVFLQSMNHQYSSRGLSVVAVDASGFFNHQTISSEELANAAADWHLDFPLVEDLEGTLAQQFKIQTLPTIVLLDASGNVVKTWQGFTRPAALAQGIETLVGGPLSQLPEIAP